MEVEIVSYDEIFQPEDYQVYLTISEWISRGDLDRYLQRLKSEINERIHIKAYSESAYAAKHRLELQ